MRIDPVDLEFYERVINDVTSSNALPFTVPLDQMPRIVEKASKVAYEWNPDATQNSWLVVPASMINASRRESGSLNAPIKLPDYVKAIFQVYSTNNISNYGNELIRRTAVDQSIISNSISSSSINTGTTFRNGYGGTKGSVSSAVVSLFENSVYRGLTNKGIRMSFNEHSGILNVQGANQGASLVLDCMIKIDLADLYKDYTFENYVIAMVNERLGKIVSTFKFQYPGAVEIDYDSIREDGKDARKEIEEYWANMQSNDMIFSA